MQKAVNVSTVPQRSPFRYPGGKTWLIPQVRSWLAVHGGSNTRLIEPFAGGGIVTLTAVMEGLVGGSIMVEIDSDVAAVWRAILGRSGPALARQVQAFDFNEQNVLSVLNGRPTNLREHAFQIVIKNRVRRNGILAPGAGILRSGESGYGLESRWYPDTLAERISEIVKHREMITFKHGDGLRFLRKCAKEENLVYFIDPPYDAAGRRLYPRYYINHDKLFRIAQTLEGDFLMTYNRTKEILGLARKHGFRAEPILMNGGSNTERVELLIARDLNWFLRASEQRSSAREPEFTEST